MTMKPKLLFSWAVTVAGKPEWEQCVNAHTSGKAKSSYYYELKESWPDIPFTAIRCRKIGSPRSSEAFIRNAVYRGLPDVRCGQRVKVGTAVGVIVGHNSSANFDVTFDSDSPKYAGLTLNCHPSDIELVL